METVKILGEEARQLFERLKGKWVLRSVYLKETNNDLGIPKTIMNNDYSYTRMPVKIMDVTETHVIIYESYKLDFPAQLKIDEEILDAKYYDSNWVECPEVIANKYERKLYEAK